MKFLFPTFLFAFAAIAVPIIIHLFSFKRYKTIYFSNIDFLKDIKKESKKKSLLKQILQLLARILSIIFLVLAFSQPYIPSNRDAQKQAQQLVAVYIDNSFSMNALSEQGQLLEVARNKAVEIAMAYPAGTNFKLFTNDLKAKHQHTYNKEQFIKEVTEVQTSPAHIPLSLVYNRFASQHSETEQKSDKNLYFISDFQRSISDIEAFKPANIFSYYLPLVPNEVANLYIDSCWVEVPAHRLGQEEQLFVRIKNSSKQNYQNLPLKLYLNDSIKSITNFSVDAQNEVLTELKYSNHTPGAQLGKIEISDYPFTHDNNWYISYFVEKNLKALAIFENSPQSKEGLNYLKALFANDDYVQLDEMNVQNLQLSRLSEYNTVFLLNLENFSSGFLNQLQQAAEKGTSVALFPTINKSALNNNNLLAKFGAHRIVGIDSTSQQISGIDFDNRFYKDVFKEREQNPILPEIKNHLRFSSTTRSNENNLLWFQNGDRALSQLDYKNGKVWVFSFPLNTKNQSFAHDILFVPTLYNIVLNSLPKQKIAYTVGENNFFALPRNLNFNSNAQFEIEQKESGDKFVANKSNIAAGTRLDFGEQITTDGHYLVKNDNETVATVAFNYNRRESDLRYFTPNELNNLLEVNQQNNATLIEDVESNFSEIFEDLENGKQLWKLCILLALLFILAEVLIARFWK